MQKPQRLQRRRVKGFDMQAVSRATNGLPGKSVCRPGKYGNPFKVGDFTTDSYLNCRDVKQAIEAFGRYLEHDPKGRAVKMDAKKELRGFNLFCFCKEGEPCHGDELLRIANED